MGNYLFLFLFLNVFVIHAQKDSVRLVDIQSSECGGMNYVKPHFLSKKILGDTTYISLSCNNNCGGYHEPSVNLYGDSVAIRVLPGVKETGYIIHQEYVPEDELKELGLETYRDSTHLKQERHRMASCDCCFTFNLKIIGLSVSENYRYFYNGRFIDPDYKGPSPFMPVKYEHFLNEPKSKVFKKIKRVVSSEKLQKLIVENGLTIYLYVDTVTCSFKEVVARCSANDNILSAEHKLRDYFQSLSPSCIFNPNKHKMIEEFLIEVRYDETGKLEMEYVPEEIYNPYR